MWGLWLDGPERAARAVSAELVAKGVLEPLERAEEPLWLEHELEALVELNLEPLHGPYTREAGPAWEQRLLATGIRLVTPRACAAEGFWLLQAGERVGTVALGERLREGWLELTSLFVERRARGHGTARAMLEATVSAVGAQRGRGVRLTTSWCWRRTLLYYLRAGAWVHGWRGDIELELPATDERPWVTAPNEDTRELWLRAGGQERVLLRANDVGRTLVLEWCGSRADERLRPTATATLSAHLALAGFPLVRTRREWDRRHRHVHGQQPEGLAERIERWETQASQRGFYVPPRPQR